MANTTSMPLRFRPRFSQNEIAKAAGVSRTAVFLLEQRALRKLKKAIEHEAQATGKTPRGWLFGDE